MTRSYKKTNKGGVTIAKSEKQDKRLANRTLRRITKQILKYDSEAILPILREVSNIWSMAKDGKRYYDEPIMLRK